MSGKIIWTGLTIILAVPVLNIPVMTGFTIGGLVMIAGCILMWFNK